MAKKMFRKLLTISAVLFMLSSQVNGDCAENCTVEYNACWLNAIELTDMCNLVADQAVEVCEINCIAMGTPPYYCEDYCAVIREEWGCQELWYSEIDACDATYSACLNACY